MIVREDVAALLRAGVPQIHICRRLHCAPLTVQQTREAIGMPAPLRGSKPKHASLEDAFRAHITATGDGHAQWVGSRAGSTPIVQHRRRFRSAYRVAFLLHHGREAEGITAPACGTPGCVAGAHLEDAVMRTARREAERVAKPAGPQPNGSRTQIAEMLGQGMSDRAIGRLLGTSPKRVARIRAELELPKSARALPPFADAWTAYAKPEEDGHTRWVGPFRSGTPVFNHGGAKYTARQAGFLLTHGRQPVGRVLPGCGMPWCVAGAHAVDTQMRRADHLFTAIFERAA